VSKRQDKEPKKLKKDTKNIEKRCQKDSIKDHQPMTINAKQMIINHQKAQTGNQPPPNRKQKARQGGPIPLCEALRPWLRRLIKLQARHKAKITSNPNSKYV
jgi:hypothetical protein